MKRIIFAMLLSFGGLTMTEVYGQGGHRTPLDNFPLITTTHTPIDTGNMSFVIVDNSGLSPVDRRMSLGQFSVYLNSSIHLLSVTDSSAFATRKRVQKAVDSLNLVMAGVAAGNDSSIYSSKAYRQKGIDSINVNMAAINAGSDTGVYASKAYRQKGVDSLSAAIAAGSDSSLYSTKAYRQKGVDSLNILIAARLSTISGISAGGDLTGTYPNPTVKASVGLTGTPTCPTATMGSSSTAIASTAYIDTHGKDSSCTTTSGTFTPTTTVTNKFYPVAYRFTSLASNITIGNTTSTWAPGQNVTFYIYTVTAKTIAYGTNYSSVSGNPLPATTFANALTVIQFEWSPELNKLIYSGGSGSAGGFQ